MKTNIRDEQVWLAVGSLMILAMATLAAILFHTKTVMIPFVLSVFFTVMISPVLDYQMIRLKFPHWAAVVTTLLLVLVILVTASLLFYAALPSVGNDSEDPRQAISGGIAGLIDDVLTTAEAWNIGLDRTVVEAKLHSLSGELQSKSLYIVNETISTATALFSQGVMILIFIIFMLCGRDPHAAPSGIYADIESKIRTYITTKFALSAVTGILVWFILSLFGLKMAALFGMMAFLLNFIPSIGSVIATLLPLPVALMQFGDPLNVWAIVGVVVLPGGVQVAVGNVIEPKIMGKGLQLHPVTILLALAFWGLLWGVIGMLLAVPMTATIRIVLMRFTITRPIGNLLAGELPGAVPQTVAE